MTIGEGFPGGAAPAEVHEQEIKPAAVAVLEAGGQYAMDIEQQVKRLGYSAERLPFDTPIEALYTYGAIILSGGPESVNDPAAPRTDPRLFRIREGRPPILGVCYGNQLMNHELGGAVSILDQREDGYTVISLGPSELSTGVAESARVIMSHGDTITELAPGFEPIAFSGDLIAGIANSQERLYGVQFHPEVSPPAGPELLRNFLHGISGLEADYTHGYEEFIADAVQETREFVGDRHVLAYISGGVDSSALAKLLERALPAEQFHLVLVDHGFMRDDEARKVVAMLDAAGVPITVYDAVEIYETATTWVDGAETPSLNQVVAPEPKRKIFGDTFITIQAHMSELLGIGDDFVLAMGSLYTDLIESGSSQASDHAATIKTHHNDTQLVRDLRAQGRVYEPWRFIQKDDVRVVARLLGLPEAIYNRQPFPGPGLGIRVICGDRPYITEDSPRIINQLEQFATPDMNVSLLPIQTVGVQGDGRTYAHLAALSGTPDWARLKMTADAIPRVVHGINRVAYVFGEPVTDGLDTITPTFLTRAVIAQLKTADAIVNRKLEAHGLDKSLSQVPVVLLPVHFGEPGKHSIAIRTFMTTNFKIGDIALPGTDFPEAVLNEIVDELLAMPGIVRVLYDLTSKPPATTEWE